VFYEITQQIVRNQLHSRGLDGQRCMHATDDKSTSAEVQASPVRLLPVLDEIMGTPNKGIPKGNPGVGQNAWRLSPSMIKGGFIIGARYGKGAWLRAARAAGKLERGPAPITIAGGRLGLASSGGEAVDLVMLVNER